MSAYVATILLSPERELFRRDDERNVFCVGEDSILQRLKDGHMYMYVARKGQIMLGQDRVRNHLDPRFNRCVYLVASNLLR
jgi:hypothetical protein